MEYSHATEDQIAFQSFQVTDAEKDLHAVVRVNLTREGTAFLIAFVDDRDGNNLPGTYLEADLTLGQAFDLISGETDPFNFVHSLRVNLNR